MKRFASHSEKEILAKRANCIPKNTARANISASSALKAYLREKSQDENFENFDSVRLAECLSHFYMDARTKDGDLYKSTTFETIRHSLNRYLKAPPFLVKFDVIKNPEFADANECFKTAMSEIKQAGKGSVDHYPVIDPHDLTKMYDSVFLAPNTPVGLANRVQMNIRLFFCRRANENMEKMTVKTFEVKRYTDTGVKYVIKKMDEMSKNHRSFDKENVSGHMPADPTNPEYCPVENFETYLSRLNPSCDRLWQYPKDSYSEEGECWYQNRPIGRDTLAKFLPTISKQVSLSSTSTNHSLRVTGTTILSRGNFCPAQIMSVTGHKSVSSLSIYQRVSDTEKRSMGGVISNTISGRDTQLVLPSTSSKMAITSGPDGDASADASSNLMARPAINNRHTVARHGSETEFTSQMDGVNLEDVLCEFDSSDNNTVNFQRNMPVFHGCTITNFNIHYHSK